MDTTRIWPKWLLGLVSSCAAAALIEVRVAAQEQEPSTPIRLTRELIVQLARKQAPDVVAAEAPRARAQAARDAANPLLVSPATTTVSAGQRWGNFGAGTELNAQVVQGFSAQGLGSRREHSAQALQTSVERAVQSARLQATERALIAWVDMLAAKAVYAQREGFHADAAALCELAERRVRSGVAEPTEAALARGEVGTAAALVLDAEGRITEAKFALNYTLGFAPDQDVEAEGELLDIAPLTPSSQTANATHPTLSRIEAEATLAASDAEVTRANTAPQWGVGASYMREGSSDQVVSGIVQVPMPWGDFGNYAAARQHVEAERLRANLTQARRELDFRRALTAHERVHTRQTYQALTVGARDPLREALRLATLRYERGVTELSTVLLARQRFVQAEERALDAAAAVQRADVQYAVALGVLDGEAPREAGTP